MANVSLSEIRKIYPNGAEALTPSSFDIADGEFVVLVGPSGCGKSTLLRMIAGLEDITEGTLRIADREMNGVDPADRNIAMVFQNYALYPHMSVYKNMAYGLRNRGTSKSDIDAAVRKAADLLNLDEFLDRKPSQLSGGQRQRVAMGRAIVRSPALFLFDEPLSNLDAKLRNQMRIEIRRLQRELGTTSVYVTHDQVEAMTMADRIVVLSKGRIEQIGTPQEIYHSPATTFVANFMGAPPMNLLDCAVTNGHVTLQDTPITGLQRPDLSGKFTLGVRAETVQLTNETNPLCVPFTLDYVEELGAMRLIHGQMAGANFTVLMPHDAALPSGELFVQLSERDLHFFDAETGQRVTA
ncbi:sn-glycerol-3-phosphate ABC transporter ATP-binding protein UgpC [Aestuariibius sp. HNIBRBA575]|uniref:sn-glycerol-3-phosphate ABC transporter ATP-binding protein UgpC n=1 Tax=Aestuariibius sp. HNIBRBA575 TaxID=3233343 RepID=UPI0034A23883